MTFEELQGRWPKVCIEQADMGWSDGRFTLEAIVNGYIRVRAWRINGDHWWLRQGAACNGLDRELGHLRKLLNGEG